ncbi:PhzF family phenazine biosynthesis protein [Hylemonella sp. W303a]|uniref:PhzF family phenazine biosynthesis protein n=1 Tax=Hylemonella sp. W303a TaxID=3389873 RepID=UPI00396B2135
MKLLQYVVDAFTSERFKGNSAAVVSLTDWLPPPLMQAIAMENNLSETAFLVQSADGRYDIRWFSPFKEIDFCGHATLASAHVLFQSGAPSPITFRAPAVGELPVVKLPDGRMEMSFPNRRPLPVDEVPKALREGLPVAPVVVLRNAQAWFAVFENEAQVRDLRPDFKRLAELGPLDVTVTAPGVSCDFVSRYFWPANGGEEDPVTGSIHAGLAPYWADRLGKNTLVAVQVSSRTGTLHCRVEGERVHVSGAAVQFLRGEIEV